MSPIFETVAQHWKGGGFGMYPIAICLVFAVAVIIDRIQVLFFSASVDKDQFLRGLKTHIFNGDLDKAISYTAGQKTTPLTNIVKAGLIIAIPSLVAFSLLQGRTQHMIDDINETSVGVLNLIVANKDKMRIPANLPQP